MEFVVDGLGLRNTGLCGELQWALLAVAGHLIRDEVAKVTTH
jgi:hypothetical protein